MAVFFHRARETVLPKTAVLPMSEKYFKLLMNFLAINLNNLRDSVIRQPVA